MKMKKIIAFSLMASTYIYAQEINKLDDVIITATKTENNAKNLTTAVEVIGSEEIENSGASNLTDILNNSGNIYVSPNGSTYRIRGMQHSDTLILIDGRRLNGEFSKTFELQRLSAGMIERIEILKGSSSLLYGSDAMGGVINIITKKAKENLSGSLQVVVAEDKKAGDFFISNTIGKTSFSLYSNYLDQDSYTKNKTENIKIMHQGEAKSLNQLPLMGSFGKLKTALTNTIGADGSYSVGKDYIYNLNVKNIGGRVSHNFTDKLNTYLDFSYLEEEKDGNYISSMYPTAYPSQNGRIMARNVLAHQYNENEKLSLGAGLNYNISQNMEIKYDISYSKYDKDRKTYTPFYSELGYSNLEASKFSENISTLKHLDNFLQFTHTLSEDNRYILGAEYRINDTQSTAFNVDDRTYSSVFAQHEYNILKDLKLIYGVRYDETSEDEDEVSFSFGGVYSLNDNITFRANYAEGFRSADDRELYVDQTNSAGKGMLGTTVINEMYGKTSITELKAETSKTFELGMLMDYELIDFELSLYQTNIDDRISQVTKNNGAYITFENIDDSEIRGLEGSVFLYPHEDLVVNLNVNLTDAKNKDTDEDLLEIPESLVGLTFSYFPLNNLELKSITKYVGSQYIDSQDKIGGYTITNFKVNITDVFKNTDFFAGIDNIFDKKTDEYLGLLPQSYVYAGIKYKF